jgi:hypothetical protein
MWLPDDYPNVGNIGSVASDFYDSVTATQFLGQVEWIYQEQLLALIFSWVAPGGTFTVEEQNLPYIARHYTSRRWRRKFPVGQHPKSASRGGVGVQNWLNFKLYSGCSPNDHRMAIYDKHLLKPLLLGAGFTKVKLSSGTVLKARATKPLVEKGTRSVDFIP